jgi:hypothetical protein
MRLPIYGSSSVGALPPTAFPGRPGLMFPRPPAGRCISLMISASPVMAVTAVNLAASAPCVPVTINASPTFSSETASAG